MMLLDILSGFSSKRNSFPVDSVKYEFGGFFRTVKGYMIFGSENVFYGSYFRDNVCFFHFSR
jgi:hypothetical protein